MSQATRATLFSGGAAGSESAFGEAAEACGLDEVTFCFDGHEPVRQRGLRLLSADDLALRDVSVQYVTRLMGRSYPSHADEPSFKALLQSICWQVLSGQEVFVVGEILRMTVSTSSSATFWLWRRRSRPRKSRSR